MKNLTRLNVAIACALVAAIGATACAEEPPAPPATGIYICNLDGHGQKVARADGGFIYLGEKLSEKLGKATLQSFTNDNSLFVFESKGAGPVPAGIDDKHLVLVVGNVTTSMSHSNRADDGRIDLSAQIEGEDNAKRIAEKLGAKLLLRQHPGHRLTVALHADKKQYAPREPVTVTMTIKNVGDKTVWFGDGGKNRGPRNNQFSFTAISNNSEAIALPDIGNPSHEGGLVGFIELEPGKTFTKQVQLSDWFTFQKPDGYRVTGSFHLELRKPRLFGFGPLTYSVSQNWDEFATAQCTVYVAQEELAGEAK